MHGHMILLARVTHQFVNTGATLPHYLGNIFDKFV